VSTTGEERSSERTLDSVRTACRRVAHAARHVRVCREGIAAYAASLPSLAAPRPGHDPASHLLGRGEETLAYFVTLGAVNFGSGYFPKLRKRAGKSGYFTIASALADLVCREGPLSADDLVTMTAERCAEVFDQDVGSAPIRELMELFAQSLRDLGLLLHRRFGGSFAALVEEADGSAERLVDLLLEMPLFHDVASYGGLDVPFYKRAQLLAADLSLAFDGQGAGRFGDLDCLTIFADNLVPHVLRLDGILFYEPGLVAQIAREELIPAGSQEEVEIRACAVEARERIVEAKRDAGEPAAAVALDAVLWNRGQGGAYKAHPRHRTRTVFY
jgi:hypothetical protein